MSVDEALHAMRSRWAHPPLDRHDVEERIAMRLRDVPPTVEVRALGPQPPWCPAVRIFVRARHDGSWSSRYVHTLGEVEPVLAALVEAA